MKLRKYSIIAFYEGEEKESQLFKYEQRALTKWNAVRIIAKKHGETMRNVKERGKYFYFPKSKLYIMVVKVR